MTYDFGMNIHYWALPLNIIMQPKWGMGGFVEIGIICFYVGIWWGGEKP